MAASFVSASSQKLTNSASPITAFPATLAFWCYPATTNLQLLAGFFDTATAINYFRIFTGVTGQFRITISDTTSGQVGASAGTTTANAWHFLVTRWISATNQRIAVLNADGSTAHGQQTASRTPLSIDTVAIGVSETSSPSNFYDGSIGEFWVTNSDIQEDGAQLQESLLWQLAYGGPFSVPHIAKDIIEYRSLRKYPSSEGDEIGEVYFGAAGRQTWTSTNGVTTGPHPPLPYWYVKPDQTIRNLTV